VSSQTKIVTDALVIKETNIGEADRLVTLLTRKGGIIKAYASGAKSIKSKRGSGSGLLSYSEFSLSKKGDTYRVTEATPKKIFFGAGTDILCLSVSQYFCELSLVFEPDGDSCEEFLRTILNSLHFLSEEKMNYKLIKAITELRIASISGYRPNLIACENCGKFEDSVMYFYLSEGNILCGNCKEDGGVILSPTVLSALRHIVYSEINKLYSFSIPETDIDRLSDICERYILCQIGHNFKTLDFLHSVE